MKKLCTLVILILFSFFSGYSFGAPIFLGPTPYLSQGDSPFNFSDPAGFIFENFEDGILNIPVILSTKPTSGLVGPRGIDPLADSVDADDGLIDGFGTQGWAFHVDPSLDSSGQSVLITFGAPFVAKSAGVVWTDGGGTATFEAFDLIGDLIGTIGPTPIGDGSSSGTTVDDRFFGVIFDPGLSAIKISNTVGGIEIDHIQFGASVTRVDVSEPATVALMAIGLIGFGFTRRRRLSAISWLRTHQHRPRSH